VPSWLFMLYGGVIADRVPRRVLGHQRRELRGIGHHGEATPFLTGTRRFARARSAFGQSSVSIRMTRAGSSASTARRAAPGKSTGKNRCAARPA